MFGRKAEGQQAPHVLTEDRAKKERDLALEGQRDQFIWMAHHMWMQRCADAVRMAAPLKSPFRIRRSSRIGIRDVAAPPLEDPVGYYIEQGAIVAEERVIRADDVRVTVMHNSFGETLYSLEDYTVALPPRTKVDWVTIDGPYPTLGAARKSLAAYLSKPNESEWHYDAAGEPINCSTEG